ncbi:MAG TPA: hypothetical protein VHB54_20850 [Mucilaginibacter sp.]|nr:hypothetical protein [Mucilaginibacter sp.]
MLNYLTFNTVSEFFCLTVALICLLKDKELIWRLLIVFLFVTTACETGGIFFATEYHDNQWLYNIFIVFEAAFVLAIFNNLFKKHGGNPLLAALGGVCFAGSYISDLMSHGFFKYSNNTFTIMSVLYVTFALYFFYLLVKSDIYIDLKYSAEFWWATGTLLFYFGTTACNIFDKHLEKILITPTLNLSYFIFAVLDVVLYGFWSYSFICKRWEAKKLEP